MPATNLPRGWLPVAAVFHVLALNGLVVWLNVPFFLLPQGGHMGHGEGLMGLEFLLAIAGLPALFLAFRLMRTRPLLGIPVLLLSQAPLPLGVALLQLAMWARDLQPD